MRRREYHEISFKLESGGIVHVRAKFNMLLLTTNDRVVMCAIADAFQSDIRRDRERWFPATTSSGRNQQE